MKRLSQQERLDRAKKRDAAAAAQYHLQYDYHLPLREEQVLSCAARGLTIRETATLLGIGAETVQTYRKHARILLNARTTTQAVYEAERRGLLPHTE